MRPHFWCFFPNCYNFRERYPVGMDKGDWDLSNGTLALKSDWSLLSYMWMPPGVPMVTSICYCLCCAHIQPSQGHNFVALKCLKKIIVGMNKGDWDLSNGTLALKSYWNLLSLLSCNCSWRSRRLGWRRPAAAVDLPRRNDWLNSHLLTWHSSDS